MFTKIRSYLLVWLTHKMALPILKFVRKPEEFKYKLSDLLTLPQNTTGYHLGQFITNNHLKLLPYYAKHDLKHILLNYPPTALGEAQLQFFMLGNRHISFPVLSTVLYSLITMPLNIKQMKNAFLRGRKNAPISKWPWQKMIEDPFLEWQLKLKN